MSISIDTLVNAIRFDVDYHCTETRETTPQQGTINKELFVRLRRARDKGKVMLPKGLRVRVLNSLCEKGTIENHELFNQAVDIFKERLDTHNTDNSHFTSENSVVITTNNRSATM